MLGSWLADGPSALLLVTALKAAAVLAFAGALALALRRSPARVRHLVWSTALSGALLLPLLSPLLPSWHLPIPTPVASAASAEAAGGVLVVPAPPRRPAAAELSPPAPAGGDRGPGQIAGGAGLPPAPTGRAAAASPMPGSWLFALWALGAAAVLAFQLLGLLRLRLLARGASSVDEPAWAELLAHCRERLGRPRWRRPVGLLVSPEARSPMTWGCLRPVILLPAASRSWSRERREVVLLHELVHIARGDWPLRVLARLASAAYWFNPLAWVAARRLEVEQELACDEAVLALGTAPSIYAGHLLAIARSLASPRFPRPALTPLSHPPLPVLDMARRSHMEGRLMSILKQRDRKLESKLLVPAALLVAALVLTLAAVEATSSPAAASGAGDLAGVLTEMGQLEEEMHGYEDRMRALEAEMRPVEESAEALERQHAEPFEAEMEALERQTAPFEERMEAVEREMRPFEERMKAVEREMRPTEDRMRAIEAELRPFEDRMEAVEREMEPIEERMEALEREVRPVERELEGLEDELEPLARQAETDPAARRALETRMRQAQQRLEPYRERMEALHRELEPYRDRMQAIHREMQPVFEKMEAIHREMEPYHERMEAIHREMGPHHERMEAIHREMEPVHRKMQEVHEKMEPLHREMEAFHEKMEPLHRRMEEIHRQMEPLHQRMEELHQRLEKELEGEIEARLGRALEGRGVSGGALSQAAHRIAEASALRLDRGRLRLLTSAPQVREIVSEATGLRPEDPALEAAVEAIVGFEVSAPAAG